MSERFFVFKIIKFISFIIILSFNSLSADEFPWTPPNNFTANPKYIALHHPVATQDPLAQIYFDQGLTFIYAFNHDAAYWSFLKASEVDPNMPMAYWGMALAIGPNINMEITPERKKAAYEIIQKAIIKSENGLEIEKDYISALAKRYSNDPAVDKKTSATNYSQAMEELRSKYPDDPDAAVLFAESVLDINPWHQWDLKGKPLPGTMKAVKTLESVLKRWPDHLGANHYYIHAVEASSRPEIALISAERLKTLLPSSGHILHMPSHIYILVGDYPQAVRSNLAAIAEDREYIREYGMNGIYPLHYLSHNYYFLTRAYILAGRFEDAKQSANELTSFYSSHFHKMEDLEYYASAPLVVLINFQRWREILALPPPNENMKGINVLQRFGRALAFARLGDSNRASEEQRLFLEGKAQLPPNSAFGYNLATQIFLVAEYFLEAKISEAQGKPDRSVEFLKKAISYQDQLFYNEPPDWFFDVRSSLGGLFLRIGKPKEAEEVFRISLQRNPRNGRALFGLRESLKAQSRFVDSYWVNEEFQKAWRNSTTPLTISEL